MNGSYDEWLWEKQGERCVASLKDHGFDAHFVPTVNEARAHILKMIEKCHSFGFAGSETTRSLGIIEELNGMGKEIFDHWKKGLGTDEYLRIRLEKGGWDCFL